jgi:D-glycero-D-manno-heptose 1,7-bisphosphate phosphatase
MNYEKFVLMDRDGVINEDSPDFIKTPDEWIPLPGSLEAIALLHKHGFKIIVITNQSGLGRGLFDATALQLIHAKMAAMAEAQGGKIERIYYCPHVPEAGCPCRKPQPGLLQAFARDYRVDLRDMPFVGDALRDVQAALAVGGKPLLVKTGKGWKTLADHPDFNFPVFENLYAVAQSLVANENS